MDEPLRLTPEQLEEFVALSLPPHGGWAGLEEPMAKLYCPAWSPDVLDLLAVARKVNAKCDMIDRQHGAPPPSETPLYFQLRDVICDLTVALETRSRDSALAWRCVAEAVCLLQDVEMRVRK